MNIVVLIKSVPLKTEVMRIEQEKLNEGDYLRYSINSYDEYAIETALSIKEHSWGGITVTAITAGRELDKNVLKKAYALGVDNVVFIQAERSLQFNPSQLAVLLGAEIGKLDSVGLILCGFKSDDLCFGVVGFKLAQTLMLPLVHRAVRVEFIDGRFVIDKNLGKGSKLVIEQAPPVVVTVEKSRPVRYPTLKRIVKAKKMTIAGRVVKAGIGSGQDFFAEIMVRKAKVRPKKIYTPEPNLAASERMKMILSGGLKAKDSVVQSSSDPETLAMAIFNYLKDSRMV